jgi:hypothetical protein
MPICDVRSCATDRLQRPLLHYSPKAISDVLEAKLPLFFLSFKGKPVAPVSIQTLPRIPADEYTAWDIPACGRKEACGVIREMIQLGAWVNSIRDRDQGYP